jgi:hypothetical protein
MAKQFKTTTSPTIAQRKSFENELPKDWSLIKEHDYAVVSERVFLRCSRRVYIPLSSLVRASHDTDIRRGLIGKLRRSHKSELTDVINIIERFLAQPNRVFKLEKVRETTSWGERNKTYINIV